MTDASNTPTEQEFVSKSGPIRQLINPTVVRLEIYLDDVLKSDPRIVTDPSASLEDNLLALENQAYWVGNSIKKIAGAVELIKSQNTEWLSLIRSLAGEELKAETKLYEQVASENNSFVITMTHGIEAMDMLDSRLLEVENTIKRLRNGVHNNQTFVPNPVNWNSQIPQQTQQASNAIRIQLPKLQLPTYFGDPLKWIEFWDAFEAAVHAQDIPGVQKFNYLLSTLKGSAYKAIEGMAITNANYNDAVEILKKRFGDPNVIKRALYSELRNLPISSGKTNELRHTLEGVDRVCRQLKSLGEDLNQPTLVIKKPDEVWQVDKLREELNNIIRIKEEAFQVLQNSSQRESNEERKPGRFSNNKSGQKPMHHSSAEAFPAITSETQRNWQQTKKGKFFPCAFCHGNHLNDQCNICHTVEERKRKVKELNLCFRCLRPGHMASQCTFNRPCSHCRGNHNRALCSKNESNSFQVGKEKESLPFTLSETHATVAKVITSEVNGTKENKDVADCHKNKVEIKNEGNFGPAVEECVEENSAVLAVPASTNDIILLTTKIKVFNPQETNTEKQIELLVFFDSGSQRSFVTNALLERLKLQPMYQEILSLNTFAASKSTTLKTTRVSIGILLKNGETKIIEANAVPKLTETLKLASLSKEDLLFLKDLQGMDTANVSVAYSCSVKPDILIGADYFWEFLENVEPKKLPSGIFLIQSKVGSMISGKQKELSKKNGEFHTVSPAVVLERSIILEKEESIQHEQNIQKTNLVQSGGDLETFWSLETIGIKDSPEIKDDDKAIENFNNSIHFKDGRYEVKWPWKSINPDLPDNYGLAFGRLKSLMNRFQQNADLLLKYDEIIQDQLSKGIIEKIDENSEQGLLKHYLPHHPVITPQKTTTKVRIVYDASAKTSKGKNSLNDCLYKGPILMPDLCGLLIRFRMAPIGITADIEKAFLQIALQVTDRDVTRFLWFLDPTNPTLENLQVYRFCRVTFGVISSPFLLNATIQYHLKQSGTETALQIANNIYVDNVIIGSKTPEEATKIYKEAKSLFHDAAMNLREWASNSKLFCEEIVEKDKLKESKIKVLGLNWDTKYDTLQISINCENESCTSKTLTKRKILQQLASSFDPLGLLAPIFLKAKVLLQTLWKEKYDWDKDLPQDIVQMWNEIVNDWKANNIFFINRCVPHAFFEAEYQLVTFVDASQLAYAATVYLRTKANGMVTTHLVFSKNRLSPMKSVSLPRLELLAAVIGSRATKKFVEQQISIPIFKKTIFTDSECVLHWLKSTKPLPVFVSNRIKELHQMKDVDFQYICTTENPADVCTCGTTSDGFENFDLWWYGPKWLKLLPEEWPKGNVPVITPEVVEEISQNKSAQAFHEATLGFIYVRIYPGIYLVY